MYRFLLIEMSKTPVQDKIANKRRTSVCAVNRPYLCSEINFLFKNIMIMKKEKKDNFVYPQSVQSDLFGYLKPAQQEFVRPLLRALKKPAQVELCCMLLDYMETGEVELGNDVVVGGMFIYISQTFNTNNYYAKHL